MENKALIVDDESPCREYIRDLLHEYWPDMLVVYEAESVAEGKRIYRDEGADLVFLDIKMNGASGFDFFNGLYHEAPVVIFTTAYAEYAIQAIKNGASDYLLKPIDKMEFKAAIEKAKKTILASQNPVEHTNYLKN